MTRMCKRLALAVVLAVVLFAPAAIADNLKYSDGGQVTGMIEGVNFLTDGLQNFYTRDNITAIELNEDGKDTLTVGDGGKREGKLVSVRLKTSDGLLAVARKQLSAIELKTEVIEEKKPSEAETKPEPTLSPEQTAALAKNRDLDKEYTAKAGEELKKFAEKQTAWKQVVDEIDRLNTTIAQKEQARAQGGNQQQQQRTWTDSSGRTHTSSVNVNNNPVNDGLQNDYRTLDKARQKLATMESGLKTEKSQIMTRVHEKEKSVQKVYDENRKAIVATNIPSEEAMIGRYKAAVAIGGPADPKKDAKGAGAKAADKQPQAAAKGEE